MLQLFGVLSVVWLVFGITLSVSMCIECSKSKVMLPTDFQLVVLVYIQPTAT